MKEGLHSVAYAGMVLIQTGNCHLGSTEAIPLISDCLIRDLPKAKAGVRGGSA